MVHDSAAEEAGVQVGDLIVDVDGEEIGSTSDLRRALAKRDGDVFDIEVIRGGRSMTLTVTLEKDDEDRPTGPRASYRIPRPGAVVAPAPVAASVPVVPPVPAKLSAPAVEVAPTLAPLPAVPLPPRPAPVAPTRNDVI
ncbi:MAG: PDZ domain-containing protein [Acidobacteria bacterium]|nr:PDZ domain-containing protein [Acidobacteriota bacterium]NIM62537.1 PDZ domain-containing protein [Acidobacteriota bacterium]NIO58270.1 PDZ domain-containing protein [Acidobacteriota bacterium]NIQ29326.1 PDZ domain-containing protein [Acidobacteriota bacterium]NIQ83926.1 PDZ domain-containing protein [Acidobacteriota bacterium]